MRLFSFFTPISKISFLVKILMVSITGALLISSCSTTKNSAYFKSLPKDTTIAGFVNPSYETKIQKRDVLGISISSLNPEMDDKFNAAATAASGNLNSAQPPKGYLVDEQGQILLHYLGNVKAEGLTRNELKLYIQKEMIPYMKEPLVTVQYLNRKVTVVGEVAKPQVLFIPDEQLTLLDALVLSGDLKEKANKTDIMIIRESGAEKKIKHINLEDHSFLSSPWYYMQPNDIVYVMSDKGVSEKEERRRTLQTTLSLVASGVSLILIILNNVLK